MFLIKPYKISSFSKRQNKPESNKNSTSCVFDTLTFAGWLQTYCKTILKLNLFEKRNAIRYNLTF